MIFQTSLRSNQIRRLLGLIRIINKASILFLLVILFIRCKKEEETGLSLLSRSKQLGLDSLQATAMQIKPSYFYNEASFVAELIPGKAIEIKAPISGVVLSLEVNDGEYVKEYQKILRLDDRQLLSKLNALELEHASVKRYYDRKNKLFEKEAVSLEELEAAEDKLILLQAQIDEVSLLIDLANIKASFSGQIGMIDIHEGAFLNQGDYITSLVNQDIIRVNADLPFEYQEFLQIGNTVKVFVQNDTVSAKVTAISPSIDHSSRTFQLRCQIDQSHSKEFKAGAYARLLIKTYVNEEALLVPTRAVVYDIDKKTIFVMKNGKVKRNEVQTGISKNDQIEIKSGLLSGDTIITSGLLQIKENIPINLIF